MALATHIFGRRAVQLVTNGALLAGLSLALARPATAQVDLSAYAAGRYQAANARYQEKPGDPTANLQFGRACFDLAEFATNNAQRASLANPGIAACRFSVSQMSNSAPAHYYLALNIGQLARTKGLGALRLVDQMEGEFKRARSLDPLIDFAGPDRNLGLLYRDAPAIASVGSRKLAREHLKRAVEGAPQYPENWLCLIDASLNWGERSEAYHEYQSLEKIWPSARTNLVGEAWAAGWADWEPRFNQLKKKFQDAAKPLGTPREK
jgi:hypothetical protein